MPDYNPNTNTYSLLPDEANFVMPALPERGADAIVIGNELDNVLTGNDGNNILAGGAGSDRLDGGLGHDTYIVDNANDIVIEAQDEGVDHVHASINYILGVFVDNLTLTGLGNLSGTGNADANFILGNVGDNILDGAGGADTLAGGKGNDTYHIAEAGDRVIEHDGEGNDTIYASVAADLRLFDHVENLFLTGADDLRGTGNDLANEMHGNAGNNFLGGGAGNDTIYGGEGTDTLYGDTGDDIFYIYDADDVAMENAFSGTDTVISTVTFSLAGQSIENLTLAGTAEINGTGNDDNNRLVGNVAKNVLNGDGGHDDLDGGAGADTLIGGAGNDAYSIDDIGDVVTENANEGFDFVQSMVSFVLQDNIEDLALIGSAGISGTGNGLDNLISGNSAGNVLEGKVGADTLLGGLGNDTYVIDDADILAELNDEGTDTVEITDAYAPLAYTLQNHFENLTLKGTRNLDGTGNSLNNAITGNAGGNTLVGNGGEDILTGGGGVDILIGGADNDLYFVDSSSDVVTEDAAGGTFDRVIAKASFVLGANIEYLALENIGGNINGTGNALDNTIFGNEGNNILDGGAGRDQLYGATGNDTVNGGDGDDTINESGDGNDILNGGTGNDDLRAEGGSDILDGGTGADALKGGAGNDTYMVDNALDAVIESAGQGSDNVIAGVSFTLAAASAVETLTAKFGTASISLSGNEFANAINGNAGKNKLSGMDGNDALAGGKGRDTFVFKTKLNKKANLDKIVDYRAVDDSMQLDNAIFKKLGKGTEKKPLKLNKAFFAIGDKAKDKNDYLVYNAKKAILYYDADGSGKTKMVEFATFKKGVGLTADEFFII